MDRLTLTWNLPCGQVDIDLEFIRGQESFEVEFSLWTG